ncbi:MAG TPA: hypothetical protein VI455_00955, partial [Terriglobia bacterium]
ARAIQFTRGRPYKKDDNAHIEQKNWTHVRRLLGYVRYDSEAAREAMNELYSQELRLFHNLFLPSVKLAKKARVGSRLRRRYEAPQTPFQRVAASPAADPERLEELQRLGERLDPFELSRLIQTKLEGIFKLSRSAVNKTPALAAPPPRRAGVSEAKDHSDARAKARTARGEKDKKQKHIQRKKEAPAPRRVTFLHCKTIC